VTTWLTRKLYSRTPVWVLLIFIFAPLIGVIAALSVRITVEGRLPGCARCVSERRQFRLQLAGAWIAVGLIATGAIAANSGALAWLLLLAAFAALFFSFSGDYFRVRGAVSSDQYWVELKGASEPFVREINHALHAPAPVVQPASYAPTASGWGTATADYFSPL
jgi:hypothetical protein